MFRNLLFFFHSMLPETYSIQYMSHRAKEKLVFERKAGDTAQEKPAEETPVEG